MGRMRLTERLRSVYDLSEKRPVGRQSNRLITIFHPRDGKSPLARLALAPWRPLRIRLTTSLGHRLGGSLDGTSGEISYIFSLCFAVLLKQLRRLYTGGFIFQVPPVSDYSTCCTNPVRTRSVHQPCLRVRCTDHPLTRLVHL